MKSISSIWIRFGEGVLEEDDEACTLFARFDYQGDGLDAIDTWLCQGELDRYDGVADSPSGRLQKMPLRDPARLAEIGALLKGVSDQVLAWKAEYSAEGGRLTGWNAEWNLAVKFSDGSSKAVAGDAYPVGWSHFLRLLQELFPERSLLWNPGEERRAAMPALEKPVRLKLSLQDEQGQASASLEISSAGDGLAASFEADGEAGRRIWSWKNPDEARWISRWLQLFQGLKRRPRKLVKHLEAYRLHQEWLEKTAARLSSQARRQAEEPGACFGRPEARTLEGRHVIIGLALEEGQACHEEVVPCQIEHDTAWEDVDRLLDLADWMAPELKLFARLGESRSFDVEVIHLEEGSCMMPGYHRELSVRLACRDGVLHSIETSAFESDSYFEGMELPPDEIKQAVLRDPACLAEVCGLMRSFNELVRSWQDSYADPWVCDGGCWKIQVDFPDGTNRRISGVNAWPIGWTRLLRLMQRIFPEQRLLPRQESPRPLRKLRRVRRESEK